MYVPKYLSKLFLLILSLAGKQKFKRCAFFLLHGDEKRAIHTAYFFLRERPLYFPAAKGAAYGPADSAATIAAIYSFTSPFDGGGANPKLAYIDTARFASALLKLPTIYFRHTYILPL